MRYVEHSRQYASRVFRLILGAVIAIALCLPATGLAFAGEPASSGPEPRMTDTSSIIKGGVGSMTASTNANYSNDLFGGVTPHELDVAKSVDLNFDLDYDPAASHDPIAGGDTLSIAIKPVDGTPDVLRVYWGFEANKDVVLNGVKIADLSYPDHRAMVFTFVDGLESTAFWTTDTVHLDWSIDKDALTTYFEAHPDQDSVILDYQLYVNDQPVQGKTLKIKVKNGLVPESAKFVKTSGLYQEPQVGDTSHGSILYSIYVSTKLDTNNEFVFYDTPDVNQRFDGAFDIAIPESYKGGGSALFLENGNHYKSTDAPVSPAVEPMEVWLYDVYFLTEEATPDEPREAKYENVTLTYPDRLVEGRPYASDTPAAVPSNILLEKLAGEPLTAEEQAKIDAAGGLNETVGKGFKVRIKNFHGVNSPGGFITMTYRVNLVNNSPVFDEDGYPVFSNTASYYGQEIPIAPGEPVDHEGSTLDAVIKGDTTGTGTVKPDGVVVDGEKYGTVAFTKMGEAAEDGAAEKPLAGAVFTVYSIDEQGARSVAVTEEGVVLENLVTNVEGKLCAPGSSEPVDLTLKWGSYVFVETAAPEGYVIDVAATPATVGFIPCDVTVSNSLKPVDPGPENPDGGDEGGKDPVDPENPGGGDEGGEKPGVPGEGDGEPGAPEGNEPGAGSSDGQPGDNPNSESTGKAAPLSAIAKTGDDSAALVVAIAATALCACVVLAISRARRGEKSDD